MLTFENASVSKTESRMNLKRVYWTAALIFVGWLLLHFIGEPARPIGQIGTKKQVFFTPAELIPNIAGEFCLAAALLGVGVYLIGESGIRHKLAALGIGILSALMRTAILTTERYMRQAMPGMPLSNLLDFREYRITKDFMNALIVYGITLGIAALASFLLTKKEESKKRLISSGIAAAVYLYGSFGAGFLRWKMLLTPELYLQGLINFFRTPLRFLFLPALFLFLTVVFLNRLQSMTNEEVRLTGIGKAWAWIAAIAMFLAAVGLVLIRFGFIHLGAKNYTTSFLLALYGCTGYVLMLRHRRIGFFLFMATAAVVLVSQIVEAGETSVWFRFRPSLPLLYGALIGSLNPLFAWLAVRAADKASAVGSGNDSRPTPGANAPAPVSAAREETGPGTLLVRFEIDKLGGGAYGYESGKLIGEAVPAELLEGMIISDGDSAATLRGSEYVCIVGIATLTKRGVLKDEIEPRIRASEAIRAAAASPLTQLSSGTTISEPLVVDGVVRNGRIEGSGGFCASGFMAAWAKNGKSERE